MVAPPADLVQARRQSAEGQRGRTTVNAALPDSDVGVARAAIAGRRPEEARDARSWSRVEAGGWAKEGERVEYTRGPRARE